MLRRHALPDIDMRQKLAEREVECHLIIPLKPEELVDELEDLLIASYGRVPTARHLQYETWAITLRPTMPASLPQPGEPSAPIKPCACLTLSFHDSLPSYFLTRFEAVHPSMHYQGFARLLYDCAAIWTRFLLVNDPLVIQGVLNSGGTYHLVSYIDAPMDERMEAWSGPSDNEFGHGRFLKKLGFARAQHDFGQDVDCEIAFSREFHVAISDVLESEVLKDEPRRPATA